MITREKMQDLYDRAKDANGDEDIAAFAKLVEKEARAQAFKEAALTCQALIAT